MRYKLSAPAREDLLEIWRFLAEKASLDVADRILTGLHEAMTRLAASPGLGHLRTDLADEALRFWRVHSYLVLYRPEASPLEVVRVLHAARDVKTLLEEE